jgi:HSP20 family molecular chaperone IbpA
VAVATPEPSASAAPSVSGTNTVIADWDQRMIDDMHRMEAQMDQVFRNAFPSDILSGANMQRLGSSVNVENQKDKYIVHFTLPGHDLNNVKVDFENGELHLAAQEEKKTSSNAAPNTMQSIERGHYDEVITLPSPVKENEMKVNRQANAVIVTLPKA